MGKAVQMKNVYKKIHHNLLIIFFVGIFFVTGLFSFVNTVQADITTGLTNWWKFDEVSGTTATNTAGVIDGTLTNFPVDNSGRVAGKLGNALAFNGSTDSRHVDLSSTITLSVGSAFSLGFWVTKDSGTGYFTGGSTAGNGVTMHATIYTISVFAGNAARVGSDYPTPTITNSTQAANWHHVTITKSSAGWWKVYIDGALASSHSSVSTTDATMTLLNIGARINGESLYHNGKIDDVRIYSRALSSSDVSELYAYVYTAPTLTTEAASSVTSAGATLNGTITNDGGVSATTRGFTYGLTTAYGTTTTESGTFSTGAYTGSATSLTCETTYYYRAYATNSEGTGYASGTTFDTSDCPVSAPTVSVSAASAVATSTATFNGSIDDTGGANATTRGFEYGTTDSYGTIVSTNGSYDTGSFSSNVTGLACSTLFHYRSYATNSSGTASSTDQTFSTTACPPTVSVPTASSVTSFTATLNGEITDIGGASVTTRGFEYGTSTSAYIQSTSTSGTYSAETFSLPADNMQCNKTYYVRAYATNSGSTVSSTATTFTTSACPTDFYVSPTGSSLNNGSIGYPWILQTALSGGLGGIPVSSTIWLRDGTYTSPAQNNSNGTLTEKLFVGTIDGTAVSPITFRQYPGERATIDGGIESQGDYTIFQGFEIMNSTDRTVCADERAPGLTLYGLANKARNMIIHDAGHPGIGFWSTVGDGGELYGNVMWANGIYDTCTSPGTEESPWTRGSAFYMQNETGTRYVKDNISFWAFTSGMKTYGENTSGFHFENNIVFNNPYANIEAVSNGVATKRLKLINNYLYRASTDAAAGFLIGIFSDIYGVGNDIEVTGNYAVNGDIIPWPNGSGTYPQAIMAINNFSDITVTNNTFIGDFVNLSIDTDRSPTYTWDNNTYWFNPLRNSHPNYPFSYFTTNSYISFTYTNYFFANWKTNCNCDASSTYNQTYPTTNNIVVLPNIYEDGRANIAVYNWEGLSDVDVDVSSVLNPNDEYEVRDVENYYGTLAAEGTYEGGTISLPMDLTATSTIVGTLPKYYPKTPLEFNTFVLIRTVAAATTTPTVSISSATSLTTTGATLNGTINYTGGTNSTVRGFAYGTNTSYNLATTTEDGSFGTGDFTLDITGLTCATTYHVRAYATNTVGNGYSSDQTFTTSDCPTSAGTNAGSGIFFETRQSISPTQTPTETETTTRQTPEVNNKDIFLNIINSISTDSNKEKEADTVINKVFTKLGITNITSPPNTKNSPISFPSVLDKKETVAQISAVQSEVNKTDNNKTKVDGKIKTLAKTINTIFLNKIITNIIVFIISLFS